MAAARASNKPPKPPPTIADENVGDVPGVAAEAIDQPSVEAPPTDETAPTKAEQHVTYTSSVDVFLGRLIPAGTRFSAPASQAPAPSWSRVAPAVAESNTTEGSTKKRGADRSVLS